MKKWDVYSYVMTSCLFFIIYNFLLFYVFKKFGYTHHIINYQVILLVLAIIITIYFALTALVNAHENGFGTPLGSKFMEENEIFEIMGKPIKADDENNLLHYCFVKDRDGRIWAVKIEIPNNSELGKVHNIFKIINGEISPYPQN